MATCWHGKSFAEDPMATRGFCGATTHGMSMLLKQMQTPDRPDEIEQEYQRIVAEQRVIQDTPQYSWAPGTAAGVDVLPAPSGGEVSKNPIDAPVILSNSLRRH